MKLLGAMLLAFGLFVPMQAHAITNGSFETGDLTGWVLEQGNAEVVNPSMFNANAPLASDGYSMLLLSSGFDILGMGQDPYTDIDMDGVNEWDVAIVSQTFTVASSGVLSFNAMRLTGEMTDNTAIGNHDPAACFVDVYTNIVYGTITADPYGAVPPYTGALSWAGPFDVYGTTVMSPGLTNASVFATGKTPYTTVAVPLAAGTHTLVCMQGDAGDDIVDSGLIIDNVVFTPGGGGGGGCSLDASAGFDPLFGMLVLLAFGALYRRRNDI